MPSKDPLEVILYKLTSEPVLIGRGRPPQGIEVQMRSVEDDKMWFSRDLGSSCGGDYSATIKHRTLPVYCYVKPVPQAENEKRLLPNHPEYKAELYYFAIEPALKEILEAPFRKELVSAWELADLERNRRLYKQKEVENLNTSRNNLIAEIRKFRTAPLWRRLLIAVCPHRCWP